MTVQFKLDISKINESNMNSFYRSMLINIHEAIEDPEYIKEFNEWKEKRKNES